MADRPRSKKNKPVATDSRIAAFEILRSVLIRKRSLDDALADSEAFSLLSPEDRAYAGFLARTTIRRLGQIDALIDHCMSHALPKKARPVNDVLRIGIAQLLFSATAEHAAVSTTVDLCRAVEQVPFAKLVNAVMRRLQREGRTLLCAQDEPKLNTRGWLWDSWCQQYGEQTARAIAMAHLDIPPIDLTPKSSPQIWNDKLGGEVVLVGSIRLTGVQNVPDIEGYAEGQWWVQDAAARLPVSLLGDINGKLVYDLCAAPGGKTLELVNQGAQVHAVDISERRLSRLRENLERMGFEATLSTADVRAFKPDQRADIVLLDAPCSSTGTLRRHPDVGHLKTDADVSKLADVQKELLKSAADLVKPGGILMYVTCSLQPEEGEHQIKSFLESVPNFVRKPISPDELPELPSAINENGDLRTLPSFLGNKGGMDGFFAARLYKASE